MGGNIQLTEARQANTKFINTLNIKPTLSSDNVELVARVVHPKVPLELRKLNPRANDPNHVTLVSILVGVFDVSDSIIWNIIGKVVHRLAFDELRTRQQL